jgi:RNA polymerase sigma-70 factor (ECF subfamily)
VSEAELAAWLASGDARAAAELVSRFDSDVRRALSRVLRSRTDLDDLAQETFLIALRRIGTLSHPEALRPFVVSIAIRVAQNERRRRRRRCTVGLEEAERDPNIRDASARESLIHARLMLYCLDSEVRTLFVLKHVAELELRDIARVQRLSLTTVKRRLAHARRRFLTLNASFLHFDGAPKKN